MKARVHDPLRLDIGAAAAEGAALAGRWPLASMSRLHAGGDADLEVTWTARFGQRAAHGAAPQLRLHLRAEAQVARECQRCLLPVLLSLQVDRAFRFMPTEEEAAAVDADSEDDVLAASPSFDLRALVEDELLLTLPLVPKHDSCPLPWRPEETALDTKPESPFAALAGLKRGDGH